MKSIYKILVVIFLYLFVFQYNANAQSVYGIIKGSEIVNGKEQIEELVGASVYWKGTSKGTVSDVNGHFELPRTSAKQTQLVFSFVGYQPDTISVEAIRNEVNITLISNAMLLEVLVKANVGGEYVSKLNPIYTTSITSAGLQELPCCNLSESFENNASVNVSYSDAVTGAKQIQMLGLAGIYSQILTENMPSVRGLATSYGLSHIPGAWMESIQISKGTSAVVNGYESITGQINVEYKKPEKSDRLFVNLYANADGRAETNLTSAFKLNKNLSTMLFAHVSTFWNAMDENGDNFMDSPNYTQYNFINRWKYLGDDGLEIQLMMKALDEKRTSGQMHLMENSTEPKYVIGINTRRYELYSKIGFPLSKDFSKSVGFQFSGIHHEQDSHFGITKYAGNENSGYANMIIQMNSADNKHSLSYGASFMYDGYTENTDKYHNDSTITRIEKVPGVYGQYTFSLEHKLSVILGLRADFHNVYGRYITPRVHFKYNVTDKTIVRASAGRGYRSVNVFAETMGLFASSRNWVINNELQNEEAWNYGINFTHDIEFSMKNDLKFSFDYYRTEFTKQVLVNLDNSTSQAIFYNLDGKSYSNSFQAEVSTLLFNFMEATAAFRVNDVKVTQSDKLVEKPFVSRYKGLFTYSIWSKYEKWRLDLTNQFNGSTRLPNTTMNPTEYQRNERSPQYIIIHAQVTRKFKRFDVYAGAENLTNYKQKNPIVSPEHPTNQYFDASMVWGPMEGRMIYAGLRFSIK